MRRAVLDDQGHLVSLEAEPATDADRSEARSAGLVELRRIDQLRVPLPLATAAAPDAPATRDYRPDADDDAVLGVNNRAFHWHPDQSGWTHDDLRARRAEAWFDASGFRVLELDGDVVGFCWTKIHPATELDPQLGEIYVIAVDPSCHGRGFGRLLTIDGMSHLAARGVRTGMLHVEHDNVAAQRLYADLGFREHHCHCWWGAPDADIPSAR